MQNEDDLRALAKIITFIQAVGIICNASNIYWFLSMTGRQRLNIRDYRPYSAGIPADDGILFLTPLLKTVRLSAAPDRLSGFTGY